jgi:hypothetical protein
MSFGQNTVSTSVSFTKLDFFHGVEYSRKFDAFEVFTGFEYGIVRTAFQSRFFPKMKIGAGYFPLNRERFQLGPVFQYGFSYLQYSKTPKGITNYHELNTGLRWKYGKKWQIGQTLLLGGLWERSYNTIYQKNKTYGTWGYVLQIDFGYVF